MIKLDIIEKEKPGGAGKAFLIKASDTQRTALPNSIRTEEILDPAEREDLQKILAYMITYEDAQKLAEEKPNEFIGLLLSMPLRARRTIFLLPLVAESLFSAGGETKEKAKALLATLEKGPEGPAPR